MPILGILLGIIALFVFRGFADRTTGWQKEKAALFGQYFGRQLTMEEVDEWMRRDNEIDKKYKKPWTRLRK